MLLTFENAAAFAQNIVKSGICGRGKRTNDPAAPAVFDNRKGGVYGNGSGTWRYSRLCVFAQRSTPRCAPVCP